MSHYFQTPTGPENRRTVKMRFWDTEWEFATADGIFSGNGLDLGTAVLLRESVPPAQPARDRTGPPPQRAGAAPGGRQSAAGGARP